jgi:hypothetical protein
MLAVIPAAKMLRQPTPFPSSAAPRVQEAPTAGRSQAAAEVGRASVWRLSGRVPHHLQVRQPLAEDQELTAAHIIRNYRSRRMAVCLRGRCCSHPLHAPTRRRALQRAHSEVTAGLARMLSHDDSAYVAA